MQICIWNRLVDKITHIEEEEKEEEEGGGGEEEEEKTWV